MSVGWEGIGAWECGAKITGILVDADYHLDDHGYNNFGVIEEPLPHLPDAADARVPTRELIDRIPIYDDRYFQRLTTGSLYDVVGLEVRRRGDRCLGLRILHANERDDYLGSWDPLDTSSIFPLYDTRQGPLRALQVRSVEGGNGLLVYDMTAVLYEEAPRCREEDHSIPTKATIIHDTFSCGEPGKVRSSMHKYGIWSR